MRRQDANTGDYERFADEEPLVVRTPPYREMNARFRAAMIAAGYQPTAPDEVQEQDEDEEEEQEIGPPQARVGESRLALIARVVSWKYEITRAELTSNSRKQNVSFPRQIAMHIARRVTERSLERISRAYGRMDHSTCLHASRRIAQMRTADPTFDAELSELETICRQEATHDSQ